MSAIFDDQRPGDAGLPWCCEAEQSVLGGLLIDNDAMARVSGLIDLSSFWHGPHRIVFEAIKRLVGAGQPADTVTVLDALADEGQAEAVGGLQYLNALAQSVPSTANIVRYASIVADKALRRTILAAAEDLPSLVRAAESADAALEQAQTVLASLKRTRATGEPQSLGDLLVARTAHWEALQAGEMAPGIPTGLPGLDDALGGGIKPGKVIVLAARPSVGKTSLATQILLGVAAQGQGCLMLSQEMVAGELVDRATAHLGRVHLGHLTTGRFDGDDWARITETADRSKRLPAFIDEQPSLTLLDIRAKARQIQRRGGLALLVIDYLQLCANSGSDRRHRHHQIEEISRGLKTLAKELGITVLLLSQLNRASEGDEPELHHLKESGSIEEDADTVLLLHPVCSEVDGSLRVLLKVAKNRAGRRGRMALCFDGKTQRWTESTADVSRRKQ